MTNILKAFGIVFLVSVALFGVLKLLGLATADNAKLALTPFAAITLVYGKLEEKEKQGKEQGKLQTFSDFSFSLWKVLALGLITALAAVELTTVVGFFLASTIRTTDKLVSAESIARISLLAAAPLNLYLLFVVGRWIGVRAKKQGFLAAALVGSLCKLIDALAAAFPFTHAAWLRFYELNGMNQIPVRYYFALGCVVYGCVCMLGCWAGIRRREAWYLNHLLKSVAPASRAAIIDIAYEEAQKTVATVPAMP